MKTNQFCPQRKPEEETHQGDNEAKKSKPEPAVNGGGAAAAPSGKEVPEKMEEEVGSRVRTWCPVFFFCLFPVLLRSGFVPGWFYCLLVFMGLPARGGVFQAARLHLVLWCLTPSELGR